MGLCQADISFIGTARRLTEKGERDLNILISRDKLKEWAQNKDKCKTHWAATVILLNLINFFSTLMWMNLISFFSRTRRSLRPTGRSASVIKITSCVPHFSHTLFSCNTVQVWVQLQRIWWSGCFPPSYNVTPAKQREGRGPSSMQPNQIR